MTTRFEPKWKFFLNKHGGFFSYEQCPLHQLDKTPITDTERLKGIVLQFEDFALRVCASYGIVNAGETPKSGVGWQCEHLIPGDDKFICDLLPETACRMCGQHGAHLCERHLKALINFVAGRDTSADVKCPHCGKTFECVEIRQILEAVTEVDRKVQDEKN